MCIHVESVTLLSWRMVSPIRYTHVYSCRMSYSVTLSCLFRFKTPVIRHRAISSKLRRVLGFFWRSLPPAEFSVRYVADLPENDFSTMSLACFDRPEAPPMTLERCDKIASKTCQYEGPVSAVPQGATPFQDALKSSKVTPRPSKTAPSSMFDLVGAALGVPMDFDIKNDGGTAQRT